MAYLTCDIFSNINSTKQYGRKGQEIEVVSDHGGIFIVRPKGASTGFHVLRHEWSEDPVDPDAPEPGAAQVEIKKPSTTKRTHRLVPPSIETQDKGTQGSLF